MTLRTAVERCVVGLAVAGAAACSDGAGPGAANSPQAGPVVEEIEHEACNPAGHRVETFDARGDGKAAVTKVYDGSHEICRITDINHDGKPDLYEYFDSTGAVRRREADYDGNGSIDSVEFFEGGKLVKREYDTTGQHRVDTWDYFDKLSGKRVRRERDTTNDGRVDQWWTWDGEKITIAIDRNGDGKPDPDGTLVLDEKTAEPSAKDAKSPPPPPPPQPPRPEAPSLIDTARDNSQHSGASK